MIRCSRVAAAGAARLGFETAQLPVPLAAAAAGAEGLEQGAGVDPSYRALCMSHASEETTCPSLTFTGVLVSTILITAGVHRCGYTRIRNARKSTHSA
jgi:hypothetical protein